MKIGFLKTAYKSSMYLLNSLRYPTCKILAFVPYHCVLGKSVVISKGCVIQDGVAIGDFTFLNNDVVLGTNAKSIGKFCSISHGAKIGLGPHPHSSVSTSPVFYSHKRGFVSTSTYSHLEEGGYTVIENDVLIGANALVMAGIKIGNGAIIGSGSVVTKDIPPYAIAVGNPAKVIRYRFTDDIIEDLEKSRWWDLEAELLKSKIELMNDPPSFIEEISKAR